MHTAYILHTYFRILEFSGSFVKKSLFNQTNANLPICKISYYLQDRNIAKSGCENEALFRQGCVECRIVCIGCNPSFKAIVMYRHHGCRM